MDERLLFIHEIAYWGLRMYPDRVGEYLDLSDDEIDNLYEYLYSLLEASNENKDTAKGGSDR